MIYAAASVAGAMVEILVHYAALPQGMCLTRIEIPDGVSIGTAVAALNFDALMGNAGMSGLVSFLMSGAGEEPAEALPGPATEPAVPEWVRDLEQTRRMGSAWLTGRESAVLIVPSSAVHGENNYLFNPDHPDFARITFRPSQPFQFDPRLK